MQQQMNPFGYQHAPGFGMPLPGAPPAVLDFKDGLVNNPFGEHAQQQLADMYNMNGAHMAGLYNPLAMQNQHQQMLQQHLFQQQQLQQQHMQQHLLQAPTSPYGVPLGSELHNELAQAHMLSLMQQQVHGNALAREAKPRKNKPKAAKPVDVNAEIRRCINRRGKEGAYS